MNAVVVGSTHTKLIYVVEVISTLWVTSHTNLELYVCAITKYGWNSIICISSAKKTVVMELTPKWSTLIVRSTHIVTPHEDQYTQPEWAIWGLVWPLWWQMSVCYTTYTSWGGLGACFPGKMFKSGIFDSFWGHFWAKMLLESPYL